jgi:hypothetical protein
MKTLKHQYVLLNGVEYIKKGIYLVRAFPKKATNER